MGNNAVIMSYLDRFLEVLDARTSVEVFRLIDTPDGHKRELLRATKLYYLLSDQEFLGKYKNYSVVGLRVSLDVMILIKEAE